MTANIPRNTTLDPPIRAMPTDSLRFWPPDNVVVSSFSFSVRPTSIMVAFHVTGSSGGGTEEGQARVG